MSRKPSSGRDMDRGGRGGRESVDMEKDEFVERGGGGSDKGLKKPL